MNVTYQPDGFIDADEGRVWQRARDLERFAPLASLSTASGSVAVALCLWPLLPQWWPAWLVSGLGLAAIQWRARRLVCRPGAVPRASDLRHWVIVNAFVSGSFFGGTSVMFYPSGSVEHQLLLAFILTLITALWLPFYAFVRF